MNQYMVRMYSTQDLFDCWGEGGCRVEVKTLSGLKFITMSRIQNIYVNRLIPGAESL